ncbi:DUF4012 domain-containing protein [bacterium]|nr:MAG: DUF4012 domain-containing protein [bacterium]
MSFRVDKNNILKQMFDVRPTNKAGDLDVQKIISSGQAVDLREIEKNRKDKMRRSILDLTNNVEQPQFQKKIVEEIYQTERDIAKVEALRFKDFHEQINDGIEEDARDPEVCLKEEIYLKEIEDEESLFENFEQSVDKISDIFSPITSYWKQSLAIFAVGCFLIASSIGVLAFYQKETQKVVDIKALSASGVAMLMQAKDSAENADFQSTVKRFEEAFQFFDKARDEISIPENLIANLPNLVGQSSTVASGVDLIETGRHISQAGVNLSKAILPLFSQKEEIRINEVIINARSLLAQTIIEIEQASEKVEKIDIAKLPPEIMGQVIMLKNMLPDSLDIIKEYSQYLDEIFAILGNNNPRKYLLLFQNNTEIRATGGFIGSFGVVDVFQGEISNLKVNDIYSSAWQLLEKIVPPLPFKKVTDKWNIFDANYFANFPTSAKKVEWFYEKTGGPTVDGVITFTPKVLGDLLQITGDIDMPEYETKITSENFLNILQYKVEEDFDKDENKPKQIVVDLAEKILDKLMNSAQNDWTQIWETLKASLEQKHILVYFNDTQEQKMASINKISGEILSSTQDYLQVVHTNINGYKTDRMISENVNHKIVIADDMSVTDTAVITKKHSGGNTEFDWYNRQNGDFIRIYVPLGSELISASGFSTEEIYSKTKDFSDFTHDPDVEKIEQTMRRDEDSGVFIFEESGKIVFAGWMYTEPRSTSNVSVTYKLPFKVSADDTSYDILYQKQSGHPGSTLQVESEKFGDNIESATIHLIKDGYYNIEL